MHDGEDVSGATEATRKPEVFLFDGFRYDLTSGCLYRLNGAAAPEPVPIGARALALLRVFVQAPGKLITKDEIFAAVWPGTAVEEANLTVQISALRRILDQAREQGSCIQTVSGRGYRFIAPVQAERSSTKPGLKDVDRVATVSPVLSKHRPGSIARPLNGLIGQVVIKKKRPIVAISVSTLFVAAITIAGLSWLHSSAKQEAAAPILSIVVLPFESHNSDPEQQRFVDALTQDLTNELAHIDHMRVVSHNTALAYRYGIENTKQIGEHLNVKYALEGGVRRSAGKIYVDAELIDANADNHLWVGRYDRDESDLWSVQTYITLRIANTVKVVLEDVAAGRPTPKADVDQLLLTGRASWRKWHIEGRYEQAIQAFEQALALDPHSVEAQTWLGRVLVNRVLHQESESRLIDLKRADELVNQALAAQPANWHAHYVRGQVLAAENRCNEAILEFERTIALNGTFISAKANLGWCKFWAGSIGAAIPAQEDAARLFRADPFLSVLHYRIGIVHLIQSRTDEAISEFEKARTVNPRLAEAYAGLAAGYGLKGEIDRAALALSRARKLSRDGRYSSLAELTSIETLGDDSLRALFEKTYLIGLKKAGLPDE